MKNINLKRKNAFTIVETLVTLLAITIMISGPLVFMQKSFTYAQFIKAKIIATGLSQEGLELATSFRNADTDEFDSKAASCSGGCSIEWDGVSALPSISPCSGEDCRLYRSKDNFNYLYRASGISPNQEETNFYRKIIFTPNGSDSYTASSSVWTDINGIKVEVDLQKTIFKIRTK
jgi:type II secretory pathway pseudopilin PulG